MGRGDSQSRGKGVIGRFLAEPAAKLDEVPVGLFTTPLNYNSFQLIQGRTTDRKDKSLSVETEITIDGTVRDTILATHAGERYIAATRNFKDDEPWHPEQPVLTVYKPGGIDLDFEYWRTSTEQDVLNRSVEDGPAFTQVLPDGIHKAWVVRSEVVRYERILDGKLLSVFENPESSISQDDCAGRFIS